MIFISHRGNLNGPNKKDENNPKLVLDVIKLGFDVEVDVFFYRSNFYLGHDEPQYKVRSNFLENKSLWCHAKSIEALSKLQKIKSHYFWHQNDDVTLTSKGFIWTYPGKKLFKNSICVLPEITKYKKISCKGICSDYIIKYKKKYD